MRKTSPSERPAAQAPFAKKAANVKAAKPTTSALALDLIEANEQELAEAVLTDSNRLARKHDERSVHSARPTEARLGVRLLGKREVLAIVGTSYPTIWLWMRQHTFPRSRAVGGKSMWVSTEIEAWVDALPRRRLKGDTPPEALDTLPKRKFSSDALSEREGRR